MLVGVLGGQNRRAAGAADGVGHQTTIETNSLLGQAVQIWRLEQIPLVPISTDGRMGVVITEDEDDVGSCRCFFRPAANAGEEKWQSEEDGRKVFHLGWIADGVMAFLIVSRNSRHRP